MKEQNQALNNPLSGRRILLGVTGGIAAYKSLEIVRLLRKQGAQVQVIMTEAATKFVAPLTFRELSGNPAVVSMWEEPARWNVEHIAMATWAERVLIAPASANFIGKYTHGIADDMLSTTILATTAPVILAPAMNSNMYQHPAVQANLQCLAKRGVTLITPASGSLACGVEGIGRLPDPAVIVEAVADSFVQPKPLQGLRFLVTAGGTREPIDPVRFIGNRSSGKMGYAIAAAAVAQGAEVVLVAGPTALQPPAGVDYIAVQTAEEMRQAVLAAFDRCQVVIKAAAVADYRPQAVHQEKMKKTGQDELVIQLVKNPDILAELGARKQDQILVGFAAETNRLEEYAADKLIRKNLDMIVANDVSQAGRGFEQDTNAAIMLFRDGSQQAIPLVQKREMAEILLQTIYERFIQKK